MRFRGLRHTVEIQSLSGSTTADAYGQTQKAFATVETVQAAITPLDGQELILARQVSEQASHKVEMYNTTTVTPRARLKYGDRVLNIVSVKNVGERDRWLEILCGEEV
jgi:SPP1 family predicted phage head-tail adaptor